MARCLTGNLAVMRRSLALGRPSGVCARCAVFYTCSSSYRHFVASHEPAPDGHIDMWHLQRAARRAAQRQRLAREEERRHGRDAKRAEAEAVAA